MIHDLLIVIDIDEFSKMYTDSKITEITEGNPKKVVFLKIKVNDTDYTYKTVQTIFLDQTWSTSFLTNKNETFFEIMIESENVASCDIRLKNKKNRHTVYNVEWNTIVSFRNNLLFADILL